MELLEIIKLNFDTQISVTWLIVGFCSCVSFGFWAFLMIYIQPLIERIKRLESEQGKAESYVTRDELREYMSERIEYSKQQYEELARKIDHHIQSNERKIDKLINLVLKMPQ